jgi:hypothetical protein
MNTADTFRVCDEVVWRGWQLPKGCNSVCDSVRDLRMLPGALNVFR